MKEALTSRSLWALVRRDLLTLAGSTTTALPLLLLPLVVFAGLPLLAASAPQAVNLPVSDLDRLMTSLPVTPELLTADPDAQLSYVLLVYLLAPMLLIVPVMVTAVAAAGSIAGERERRTLELLLLSPVTDRQLALAKTLGAWLPAVVITVVGSVLYQVVATLALADLGLRPFPNVLWTVLMLWVAPALAAAALGAIVVVSARAKSFQDAMQLGGVLVLPLVGVAVAQATGVLTLGVPMLVASGALLWLLAAVLLRAGAHALERDRLSVRL